jgi:hypothetical protein
VSLLNDLNFKYQLLLTLSTSDVDIIQAHSPVINVLPMGQMKIYVANVAKPAVLLITAVSCLGKVNVYVNDDSKVLMSGIYKQEIPHHYTTNALGTVTVNEPGT